MSVIYSVAVRNARLQQVVNAIDAAGPGFLKVGTVGMGLVLTSIPLAVPCGVIAAGVLTFATPQVDFSADAAGNAAAGELTDSAGTVVASGLTVGIAGSGADLIISVIHINAGDVVTFISGTITGN